MITLQTRVAYSRGFLQSTGQTCGPAGFRRGTVVEIADPLFLVRWDDGQTQHVNRANLVAEDRLHLELI